MGSDGQRIGPVEGRTKVLYCRKCTELVAVYVVSAAVTSGGGWSLCLQYMVGKPCRLGTGSGGVLSQVAPVEGVINCNALFRHDTTI